MARVNPDTGEDFLAGYIAGFEGQPYKPPRQYPRSWRYHQGFDLGQTERLAFDARQRARRARRWATFGTTKPTEDSSMGDVEITLPRLPDPTPPDGWRIVGYEVQFLGAQEMIGKGPTLADAKKKVELDLSDNFKVFALASGRADLTQTYDDAMIAEWLPGKSKWDEWEYA